MALVALWCLSALVSGASSYRRRHDLGASENLTRSMSILDTLSDIIRLQQLAIQEAERLSGSSGFVWQRLFGRYPLDGFPNRSGDFYLPGLYSVPHEERTLGLRGVRIVMNGVQFRTGERADYRLVARGRAGRSTTKPIPFPDVPAAVQKKGTIGEQIAEMRQWFRAWAEQDASSRDYRPYFRPVICYMEGYWAKEQHRPDDDSQHLFDDTNELYMAQFGGFESLRNKTEYLPRHVWFFDSDRKPAVRQWRYEVKCHQLENDLPLSLLSVVDDLHVRIDLGLDKDDYGKSKYARFTLDTDNRGPGMWTALDDLMAEIPGRDGKRRRMMMNSPYYYHRWYHHLGIKSHHMAFSDETVFVAETTDPSVAPMEFKCSGCRDSRRRLTFAIPLEIVYMTPLQRWNPYKLGKKAAAAHHQDTVITPSHYYMTPFRFFFEPKKGLKTFPDWALKHGNYLLAASGFYVILPEIEGIGSLRIRYPIMPIHEETTRLWKRLEALKKIALEPSNYRNMFHDNLCDVCK